jgi:general stress protein 26
MSLYTQDQIHRIASKIKRIPFGMLTTQDAGGGLRSRPLDLLRIDEEGNVWLLASDEANFLDKLTAHPEVNVSFADPGHKRYLSVSGAASVCATSAPIK